MINSFDGQYEFLSNFYPCIIRFDGFMYTSVEHAYQAAKFTSPCCRQIIRNTPEPGRAKHMAKFMPCKREDWHDVKLDIMRGLLIEKFTRHYDLRFLLDATRPHELVEGNDWGDVFWGVVGNQGHNHLGKLLMEIRG